jgi:hypothetical protein
MTILGFGVGKNPQCGHGLPDSHSEPHCEHSRIFGLDRFLRFSSSRLRVRTFLRIEGPFDPVVGHAEMRERHFYRRLIAGLKLCVSSNALPHGSNATRPETGLAAGIQIDAAG